MKLYHAKSVRFIGKSLLWSLGLYISCMVLINWDEMNMSGRANKAAPISQIAPQPVNNPVQDNKPNEPQSNISGLSHALHTAEIFLVQVAKIISIVKK